MSLERQRDLLRSLAFDGVEALKQNPHLFSYGGGFGGVAYHDPRKDAVITNLDSFGSAVSSLSDIPAVQLLFGSSAAPRLALQFVYNTCKGLAVQRDYELAFGDVWKGFIEEIETPNWRYIDISNIQNFSCSGERFDLGSGVSILGRSVDNLSKLGCTEFDMRRLFDDWSHGAGSSFVLVVEHDVPKSPDNLILASDGLGNHRAALALLAMRLQGSGDVRIGKMFHIRPAFFNVGIGGSHSSGFSYWRPGPTYTLTHELADKTRSTCVELAIVESRDDKQIRSIKLATRSFSSIYDRLMHQTDDSIVDAITALEALWKAETELSFKLAFRTASLLASSDDERVSIYKTVKDYYSVRSKIVHGGSLTTPEEERLLNNDILIEIVRRTLRAFLKLSMPSCTYSLSRLYSEADQILMHSLERAELQRAAGIS